jgi:UDP-glucose 4-epimerase
VSPGGGGLDGARILVTGGSGFIGRHVVSELIARGAHVCTLDLSKPPDPDVHGVIGDITDPDVVAAALDRGIDAIVHLAAVTSVLGSLENPGETYRSNVAGTAALLEAARSASIRTIVFASTNAVVGRAAGRVIAESAGLQPLTPYGATKAASEMLMSAYSNSYGLRCPCLRLTNVYGPGMEGKQSIVARLMRATRSGSAFEIYGDGHQCRDYVHVADVVNAVKRALVSDAWRGPFVIGSGVSLSVLDVIEAVQCVTGFRLDLRHGRARPGEMRSVAVDIRRAKGAGWSPRVSFNEGLAGVWQEWSSDEAGASGRVDLVRGSIFQDSWHGFVGGQPQREAGDGLYSAGCV